MSDLLNMGVTGLLAYQRALSTTSQNITNVNTEGYSRQRVELATLPPQLTGAGYEGSGVTINGIQRVYNQFLADQVTTSTTAYYTQDTIHKYASRIDNYLADSQTGLMPALQGFFNSVQDLSNDPSSTPVRQVLLGESDSLVSRFNATYTQLKDLERGVNIDLNTAVTAVNSLSTSIARLNKDILFAQGGNQSQMPNDLLDQRQKLLNDLAQYINVSTVEQSDGTLNVFIGNGQSLVVGTRAEQLSITRNEYDSTRYEIGMVLGGTTIEVSSQLSGGIVGGALAFRRDILDPAYAAIGRVATALALDFNAQHARGIDLDGQLGGNYFADLSNSTSISSQNNAATTDYIFATTVSNTSLLQDSEYRLNYSSAGAGSYTLTRLSDNTTVASSATIAGLSTAVSASEGFTIALSSGTSISNGDRFLIRPVSLGANNFAMSVTQTNDIAAAGILATAEASANTGNGVIGAGQITARTGTTIPVSNTTLSFDTANNRFNVTYADGSTGTLAYNPATSSGSTLSLSIVDNTGTAFGTFTFTMNGTPANGDQFVISPNTSGIGDNRNALLLHRLQDTKIIGNSSTTYQDAYGQMVSNIGVKTKQADFASEANRVLNERAISANQEVSGVNLDEEAADLLKFQQAYQATARIISTADQLFQTLLSVVGR